MIGSESAIFPCASRGRRRPLLRRLLYREEPFAVLDPAQLRALFEAFACVVRLHPFVLYWIHSLGDHEYLISSFLHRSMQRYSGLEVVHVTPDDLGYYRLPGAKVGGRGRVAPGVYALAVEAPGRARHHLRVRKCRHGLLHLDEAGGAPVGAPPPVEPLARHRLDRSKFADELRANVERALEWDYQRALLGEPDLLGPGDWAELNRKCAGLSPRTDALLEQIGARRPGAREQSRGREDV